MNSIKIRPHAVMAENTGLKMLQAHFAGDYEQDGQEEIEETYKMFLDLFKKKFKKEEDTKELTRSCWFMWRQLTRGKDLDWKNDVVTQLLKAIAQFGFDSWKMTTERGFGLGPVIPRVQVRDKNRGLYNGVGSKIISYMIAMMLLNIRNDKDVLKFLLQEMIEKPVYQMQLRVDFFDEFQSDFKLGLAGRFDDDLVQKDILTRILLLNPRMYYSTQLREFFENAENSILREMVDYIKLGPFEEKPAVFPDAYVILLGFYAFKDQKELREAFFYEGAPVEALKVFLDYIKETAIPFAAELKSYIRETDYKKIWEGSEKENIMEYTRRLKEINKNVLRLYLEFKSTCGKAYKKNNQFLSKRGEIRDHDIQVDMFENIEYYSKEPRKGEYPNFVQLARKPVFENLANAVEKFFREDVYIQETPMIRIRQPMPPKTPISLF